MAGTDYITDTQQDYNTLDTDYKAEIVALNLLKYHKEVDHVFIKRLGNNNRAFHKDIKGISSQFYELNEEILFIETYREGIYDYLPEGIFHPPSLGDIRKGVDNVVVQIRKQKNIEHNARKFFQPFELETYYAELSALLIESDYDITDNNGVLMQMISELWPLLTALDQHTAKIFIHLLPFFHAVRGNKRWFEKCLTAFLQVPVTITFRPNQISKIDEVSNELTLSNVQLGISLVLCGSHLDGERNWAVNIGPVPYSELSNYMPGSDLRKLLQLFYDNCLPATVKVEEYFLTEREEHSFSLKEQGNYNRLGYSTFL